MSEPVCTGWCKGERSALDSPAKIVPAPGGRKMLWCECHNGPLRVTGESDIVPGRLLPGMDATGTLRFADDVCGYDHVLLREIKSV